MVKAKIRALEKLYFGGSANNIMPKPTRRDFLKTSSMATTGAAAYAAGLPIGSTAYGSPAEKAAQKTADEIERRFSGTLATVLNGRDIGYHYPGEKAVVKVHGLKVSDENRFIDFMAPITKEEGFMLPYYYPNESKYFRAEIAETVAKETERRFPGTLATVRDEDPDFSDTIVEVYNVRSTDRYFGAYLNFAVRVQDRFPIGISHHTEVASKRYYQREI